MSPVLELARVTVETIAQETDRTLFVLFPPTLTVMRSRKVLTIISTLVGSREASERAQDRGATSAALQEREEGQTASHVRTRRLHHAAYSQRRFVKTFLLFLSPVLPSLLCIIVDFRHGRGWAFGPLFR